MTRKHLLLVAGFLIWSVPVSDAGPRPKEIKIEGIPLSAKPDIIKIDKAIRKWFDNLPKSKYKNKYSSGATEPIKKRIKASQQQFSSMFYSGSKFKGDQEEDTWRIQVDYLRRSKDPKDDKKWRVLLYIDYPTSAQLTLEEWVKQHRFIKKEQLIECGKQYPDPCQIPLAKKLALEFSPRISEENKITYIKIGAGLSEDCIYGAEKC